MPTTRMRLVATLLSALVASACGESRLQPSVGGPTSVIDSIDVPPADRYDVLIVVDDSASMADRQADVAHAVARMIRRLAVPGCVGSDGAAIEPPVEVDELGHCPAGTVPEGAPVRDMNVGVITSSLDAPGLDGCVGDDGQLAPEHDDAGHLRSRAADGTEVATWQNQGFLVWDRDQVRTCEPQGGGYCPGIASPDELAAQVEAVVGGVGSTGCGNASSLEAAWRFLGDPAPRLASTDEESLGVDTALLDERDAFFLGQYGRADPIVVIVVSDGDDASFRADAVGAYFADPASAMPRAREDCAEDPSSVCCASCVSPAPEGCIGDGGCEAPGCIDPDECPGNFYPPGSPEHDPARRCVDAKRRFGIEGCYPTRRWVNAFGAETIAPERLDLAADSGEGVSNDLAWRPTSIVTVVDVAWQTIGRRDADGSPDLVHGLDAAGVARGGYMNAAELEASGAWDALLASSPAPRRILEVARGLGEDARIASIEPPTFSQGDGGARRLDVGFDAAVQGVVETADPVDDQLCWFFAVPDPSGAIPCRLIEARDSDGDGDPSTTPACDCALPGRADVGDADRSFADAVWMRLEEDGNDPKAFEPPGYDCLCLIPQLDGSRGDGSPLDACAHDEAPLPETDGWCYAERGDEVDPTTYGCDQSGTVRFVGRGALRPDARLFATCNGE